MKRMQGYITGVLDGSIITGEFIRLAVQRHVDDLKKDWAYHFDEKAAQRAISIFEIFRHWKGEWAGERIKLEPHQVFYIASLFGWLRKDNTRRFRTSFKSVARKNGKTTESAGKAIYHLLADKEPGGQVYFAATKEDQARIGFKDVQEIIKKTPEVRKHFKVMTKSVVMGSSFMKPLGSDSNTQDGFDPSWGVIDEYHAHRSDEMLNVLESGMGARRQPVIDVITTAGFHKEYPCYSQLRKTGIEILRGIKTDDTFLVMIFEMDEDDDWKDKKNWIKANPNLGTNVYSDYLDTRFIKAKNEGGTKEVDFKTKNLNMWVDAADVWIQDDKFQDCKVDEFPEPVEAWGGLDLASTSDITAFTLVFRGERLYSKSWYFLPKERNYDTRNEGMYKRWVTDGWLIETPGNVTDYDFVRAKINELAEKINIRSIAYDRFNANQLVINLQDDGLKMDGFGQGFVSMSAPSKEFERLIVSGEFAHLGDPVLRWMLSNVNIAMDGAGNIKVHKGNSAGKVDGVVSNIMAIGEMTSGKKELNPYANKGITFI